MKNKQIFHYLILCITSIVLLSSCGNKKYLTSEQFLYNGATIEFDESSEKEINKRKGLEFELAEIPYPTPNAKLFGIARTKLWFYNITKEPKTEKGFRNFLKYKIGEPPVLIEQTDPKRIENLITNRLYNRGYFTASVKYDAELKDKEGNIKYTVSIDKGYQIDTVTYPEPTTNLLKEIARMQPTSLLKKGEYYNLSTLKAERERVSEKLRNKGYYYFESDFLLFEVDSTISGKKVNIYLNLKENLNQDLLRVYFLTDIIINPTYDLSKKADSTKYDTLTLDGYTYLETDSTMRPEIITDAVYPDIGDPFSKEHHDYTVNRLLGLNTYQFVNINYKKIPDTPNELRATIQLTPYVKKSIRMELSAHTKSNGFTGPGFETTFKNRNLLRGGELLKINFLTGFETQVGTNSQGLNSFELGVSTELNIPRFSFPFGISSNLSRYTPQTVIKLGAKTLSRVGFFRLNSFDASFGYKWQESKTKFHELTPINLNYTKLANTEPAFDSILNTNPLVRRSFEEQFIIGSTYSFTYDQRLDNKSRNNYYFNGIIDLSGNIVQALTASSEGASFGDTTNIELLGSKFSQYLRLETTQKYYLKVGKSSEWVNRLIVGVGLPHGNSRTLPYIKQFFIGGGNSIRAFQARSIGPGSYQRPESSITDENDETISNSSLFLDQAGDIKLEINTEYRFDIYTIFKGAVFVDAGNIWLLNEDTLRPGGEFKPDKFYNQLAVGTGFGLRIDPDFFVIRLDLGFPLRVPSSTVENEAETIKLGRDPVLNIAIGYPF